MYPGGERGSLAMYVTIIIYTVHETCVYIQIPIIWITILKLTYIHNNFYDIVHSMINTIRTRLSDIYKSHCT